jgi:hypothetical protein
MLLKKKINQQSKQPKLHLSESNYNNYDGRADIKNSKTFDT